MQTISRIISDEIDSRGPLSAEELLALAHQIGDGKDSWGNPYQVEIRKTPTYSWLLVSLGSDGRLDVTNIGEYFHSVEEDIVKHPWRDIIFRDGSHVTIASHK
jgi:hypothetical protein